MELPKPPNGVDKESKKFYNDMRHYMIDWQVESMQSQTRYNAQLQSILNNQILSFFEEMKKIITQQRFEPIYVASNIVAINDKRFVQ